jgi:2-keto-4-pentenoate hydratase
MLDSLIAARAQALFEQHRDSLAFSPFAGADALAGIDEAYAVQDAFVQLMLVAESESIAGYKIGLTSARMQALLGIDSPIAGHVLSRRIFDSGHDVRRADYGRLGLECEIAVRLGRDLAPNAAPFDADSVAAAVDGVCVAFELVDDRSADYGVTDIGSLVADNSWNAGLVLGPFHSNWPDLALVEGVVTRNGTELDRGRGADVLGHPFVALRWLANHLARGQRGLRAGDIVATGSIVPTRVPEAPETCVFNIAELGEVAVVVSD